MKSAQNSLGEVSIVCGPGYSHTYVCPTIFFRALIKGYLKLSYLIRMFASPLFFFILNIYLLYIVSHCISSTYIPTSLQRYPQEEGKKGGEGREGQGILVIFLWSVTYSKSDRKGPRVRFSTRESCTLFP